MRTLLLASALGFALFALLGCETSTAPDSNSSPGPVPIDGRFDPDLGEFTLQRVDTPDSSGQPLRLDLVAKNLVIDPSSSTVALDVAIHNRSDRTLHPTIIVWLSEFLPWTVVPLDADILPHDDSTPVLGPWGFRYDELLGDGILEPGESSEFRTWTFYNPSQLSFRFAAHIDFSLHEATGRLGGIIFEDTNLDGQPSPNEPPFGAGVVFVEGPAEYTTVAEVRADGRYAVRVPEAGLYRVIYLPPPSLGFAPLHFTTPNPLQVLLLPNEKGLPTDYLEAHFGIAPGGVPFGTVEFTEDPPGEIPSDFFHLGELGLRGSLLIARVGFSGCSGGHPFRLFMSGGFAESMPVRARLVLTHDDRGEMCDAYFEESRGFELEPIQRRYHEEYGRLDPIVLVMERPDGSSIELLLLPPPDPVGR